MPPTRAHAGGLAVAACLVLVGALALPALAADSAEGAVNELIDAVERGEYASIDALVCEAERDAVREMLDPSEAMGLSAEDLPISFKVDDRALEVISEDGDEVTIRLTGTMSVDVPEEEMESLALLMLEGDMGELSEEDIEQLLPFMMMAFTQTSPMDEEITVVNEGGEWLVCGGLGEASGDDDDFDTTAEVPAEGVCGLVTPEELTAAGMIEYDSSNGWDLPTCSYTNWETGNSVSVTVEFDSDAEYAAGAYGYDQELVVAGAPAFTSDYPNSPLLVQVGPDVLNVSVWAAAAPDGYDALEHSAAIAELFAPRVAAARDDLIPPVKPLLCDLGFAADFEAAMGLPMHSGNVSPDYCSFDSQDTLTASASVTGQTFDDYLSWFPEVEETTVAGLRGFEVDTGDTEDSVEVYVELSDEQLISVTVRSAWDKPLTVSGLEVAELLTQHIVDRMAE